MSIFRENPLFNNNSKSFNNDKFGYDYIFGKFIHRETRDQIFGSLYNYSKKYFSEINLEEKRKIFLLIGFNDGSMNFTPKAFTLLLKFLKENNINYDLNSGKIDFSKIFSTFLQNNFEMETPYIEKTVIATAYYSPLKGQSFYATGSYEGDLALQGEGKITASGLKPRNGMLAAPKNWKFGTKVVLPPDVVQASGSKTVLVTVEDRGGAIVKSGKRGYKNDRIDVFFGQGEEALKRALAFGKQKINVKVAVNDKKSNLKIS